MIPHLLFPVPSFSLFLKIKCFPASANRHFFLSPALSKVTDHNVKSKTANPLTAIGCHSSRLRSSTSLKRAYEVLTVQMTSSSLKLRSCLSSVCFLLR